MLNHHLRVHRSLFSRAAPVAFQVVSESRKIARPSLDIRTLSPSKAPKVVLVWIRNAKNISRISLTLCHASVERCKWNTAASSLTNPQRGTHLYKSPLLLSYSTLFISFNMPTVAPPAKILVTGASGYLAVHTVVALVERGYNVVGTVRTPAKGEYVKNLVKKNFEYILVPDIEAPGAFDEAVKGVDAIEHSASPVEMPAGDPQPIIKATVGAIANVLEAAKKHGPTVRRIVHASSTAAVSSHLFEENYNNAAVAEVEEKGADAHSVSKYSTAKVLSERAAWDFISKNKGNIGFDLVIAVPPFLFGPHIQENLTFSGHFALGGLGPAHPKTGDELTQVGFFYLDVRDCATILAELLVEEKASNERLILIAGPWT